MAKFVDLALFSRMQDLADVLHDTSVELSDHASDQAYNWDVINGDDGDTVDGKAVELDVDTALWSVKDLSTKATEMDRDLSTFDKQLARLLALRTELGQLIERPFTGN